MNRGPDGSLSLVAKRLLCLVAGVFHPAYHPWRGQNRWKLRAKGRKRVLVFNDLGNFSPSTYRDVFRHSLLKLTSDYTEVESLVQFRG